MPRDTMDIGDLSWKRLSRRLIRRFARLEPRQKNHGSRFEGILKIEFASELLSKAQKPANSITWAHLSNSSRSTDYKCRKSTRPDRSLAWIEPEPARRFAMSLVLTALM